MSLQQSEKSPCFWGRLPPELRRRILGLLDERKYYRVFPKQQPTHQATYAIVCREWKQHFESVTFQALTLNQSDMHDFDKIVKGSRREKIQWIWLRLELPKYTCKSCKKQESPKEIRRNNLIFTNAIWDLFSILSTWDCKTCQGITLELSAHSPNDPEHFAKELAWRINHTAAATDKPR